MRLLVGRAPSGPRSHSAAHSVNPADSRHVSLARAQWASAGADIGRAVSPDLRHLREPPALPAAVRLLVAPKRRLKSELAPLAAIGQSRLSPSALAPNSAQPKISCCERCWWMSRNRSQCMPVLFVEGVPGGAGRYISEFGIYPAWVDHPKGAGTAPTAIPCAVGDTAPHHRQSVQAPHSPFAPSSCRVANTYTHPSRELVDPLLCLATVDCSICMASRPPGTSRRRHPRAPLFRGRDPAWMARIRSSTPTGTPKSGGRAAAVGAHAAIVSTVRAPDPSGVWHTHAHLAGL